LQIIHNIYFRPRYKLYFNLQRYFKLQPKLITTLCLIAFCVIYANAQSTWSSTTNYAVNAQIIASLPATNADGSITTSTYTFTSLVTPNQGNSISNGYYWSVAYTPTALPILDGYRYAIAGVLVSYNGNIYTEAFTDPRNTYSPQLSGTPKIPDYQKWTLAGWPRWTGASNTSYVNQSKVCQIVGNNLYYFVCILANSGMDPANSPTYWIVSDVITLPYSYNLHYKIPGTTITFTDGNTYSLVSEAQPGQSPSSNPSLWQKWTNSTTPPAVTSCFTNVNCTTVSGDDKSSYKLSYQPATPPVLVNVGGKYYDAENAVNATTTLVTLGEVRSPVSPLQLNSNDLLLRGSGDIYHGLGYYGSAGDIGVTTPKKRNFANTPVDGPVLFGWAGGALGIRQRANINDPASATAEQIALRWDWANVYIGSPVTKGTIGSRDYQTLGHNLVLYGSMGIGTNNPTSLLQVGDDINSTLHDNIPNGVVITSNTTNATASEKAVLELHSKNAQSVLDIEATTWGSYIGTLTNVGLGTTLPLYIQQQGGYVQFGDFNSQAPKITNFNINGAVGIGTTNTHGYKLAVNGSMVATSVEILAYANWPDYVFDKKYKLRTLRETETYISNHKHLPEVPSQEEVDKKGINVAEMNATLLKKVEELTIYMIEMQKQLDATNIELDRLKKQKQ